MGSAVERWGVLEMVASCLLISPLLPTLAELVPGDLGCWAGGHSLATTDKELECFHKLPPSLWTTRQLCQLSNITPNPSI